MNRPRSSLYARRLTSSPGAPPPAPADEGPGLYWRSPGERLVIGGVEVGVVEVRGTGVRLGVTAPREMGVRRGEDARVAGDNGGDRP